MAEFLEVTGDGTVKPIEVKIPSNVSPQASGDYVKREIEVALPNVVVPTSTASTIAFAAKEAAQEGMRLKSVKFGINLGFVNLNLEWEKKSS